MNLQQAELYQRIQSFSLDNPDAEFPFSKRLAKDNGWTAKYTQRVIDEYKKFAFLAVVAEHPVAPSDQVDQVWHLHLLYTHSYWGEFCPNVLQTPLHHGPTRGGANEHHKHNNWYRRTLASYDYFFGQQPPTDIWPPTHIRFGRDVHFRRVNTQQNLVLPKPRLHRRAVVILPLVLALTVTGCQSRNPLDFKGSEFLGFYLLLLGFVTLLAWSLRWFLRLPTNHSSEEPVSLDVYETAYLADGKVRAVDVAIAKLVQRGNLEPLSETRTLKLGSAVWNDSHPLEQAVMQAVRRNGKIEEVRRSAASATAPIGKHLQNLGLLVNETQAKLIQRLPALAIFAVLLLGISKIIVGVSRNKPVGLLIMLCLVTGVIGCFFLFTKPHRSRYGDRVLNNLRVRHTALKKTATLDSTDATSQLTLAVALFGIVVLADSALAELQRVLVPPPSSSGSSDGSSGCSGDGDGGGGGCGGGGCGGCGG